MDFTKIQSHTISIYDLNSKKYQLRRVNARSLLTPKRFDLFAKLYYIVNRNADKYNAINVYVEHIKTFNPDLKEPGRTDKNTINDFIDVFNRLILDFETKEFDNDISIIPVDSNGVILDGAHRVAALAFYNKEVTIIQFDDVYAKCEFNYFYFKKRGLKWNILDIIAQEMTKWLYNISTVCLYANTSKKLNIRTCLLSEYSIAYIKRIRIGDSSLIKFRKLIYQNHDFYLDEKKNKINPLNSFFLTGYLTLLIFEVNDTEFMKLKDGICDNHLIYISNNRKKATDILEITKSIETNLWIKVINALIEKIFYLKHVKWLKIKVDIASVFANLRNK